MNACPEVRIDTSDRVDRYLQPPNTRSDVRISHSTWSIMAEPTPPGKRTATATGIRGKEDGDRYFEFSALPRELRDMIYDFSLVLGERPTKKPSQPYSNPVVTVFDGPNAALLKINRQFSGEYNERVEKSAVLIFEDDGFSMEEVQLKGITRATSLDLHLLLRGSTPAQIIRDIQAHRRWASKLRAQLEWDVRIEIDWYLAVGHGPFALAPGAGWNEAWAVFMADETYREVVEVLKPIHMGFYAILDDLARSSCRTASSKVICYEWSPERGWYSVATAGHA
ncbi:hypothetical protein LTR53_001957 [Teratosphaeriaceae sp. CCFEE 6253]|nr:hypothetical protein LTR53_001957 [Teratosphaeriaceae sp. CCFEE 6253]